METQSVVQFSNFAETPYLQQIASRALCYLRAGLAVHLRGPAGVGKTCMAFYIAKQLGRPVEVIFGSEEVSGRDMIGGASGVDRKIVYDNYIHSVVKMQESYRDGWVDGKLLDACRNGKTLIFDEFTRTRPEILNVLLPILEEGILHVTHAKSSLKVDKDFRILFTSNPEEYVGVYHAPNALLSRMVTLGLGCPDIETESAIVAWHSGLAHNICENIVKIIQTIRAEADMGIVPSVRCSVMIGKILKANSNEIASVEGVAHIFADVLTPHDCWEVGRAERCLILSRVEKLLKDYNIIF